MTCSSNTICTPDATRRTRRWLGTALAVSLALVAGEGAGQAQSGTGSTEVSRYRARAAQELAQGRMAQAGALLNRALAIAPRDAGLWVDIARFRYRGGEHLLAITASEKALGLGPDEAAALRLKAELVRDSEGMEPALSWFEKAIERAPSDLSLKVEYAATLGEAGRAKEMLEVTRAVLEADPKNARAFYLQAVMAARAGNYALAKRLLNRTEDRLVDLPGAMLLRAIVEIDAQNYGLAIESLEQLKERQPGNRRARDLLARALFLSGDYAGLVERYGEAASRVDASAYLTMSVARAFEQLGQRDRAAPLLDRLASLPRRAPFAVSGNVPVGRMLVAGDTGSARAQVGSWLSANSGNYDHLALAGDVELVAGNPVGAIRFYERAAKIRNPDSLMARRFQALLLVGDSKGAGRLAQGWLAANPASQSARMANAWVSAGTGDWARARRLYENLASGENDSDVQLLADLAVVQVKDGDADAAIASARRAQALYRAYPLSSQALGMALAANGEQPRQVAALLAKARSMQSALR